MLHHNHQKNTNLEIFKNQISKSNFKNYLSLKNYHFLNSSTDSFSGYWSIDLANSLTIKLDGKEEYQYQKVGIYLSKLKEVLSGAPILSVWELPTVTYEKTPLKIKTLHGKLLMKEEDEKQYKIFDLKKLNWEVNKNKEHLIELISKEKNWLLEKLNSPKKWEIDIVFAISKADWTNIVHLKTNLEEISIDSQKEESLISINPYDPLLKNLKLDHTWIVEKM